MLDLGMHVIKWLAVAGGAAVGWLASGLLLRLLVRLSLRRSVPRKALLPVRTLGALALGLAVWIWVSSPGGLGPGLGGWLGLGGSGGQPPGSKISRVKADLEGSKVPHPDRRSEATGLHSFSTSGRGLKQRRSGLFWSPAGPPKVGLPKRLVLLAGRADEGSSSVTWATRKGS